MSRTYYQRTQRKVGKLSINDVQDVWHPRKLQKIPPCPRSVELAIQPR
jgi:hypothetical protein